MNQQVKQLYLDGMSAYQIADQLGVGTTTIYRWLDKLNVDRRSISDTRRQYVIDESYFSDINTERKAYYLGYIFADGNIYKNILRITSKDDDVLSQFLVDTNSTYKIKTERHNVFKTECLKITITSTQMINDLKKLGCIPNKSLIMEFPKLEDHLISHFIRGYFDGDGSVGIYKYLSNSDSITLRSSIVSGSKNFLETLINYLPTRKKNIKYKDLYYIQFSVKDSLKFYQFIYRDATIFMSRKFDKFTQFLHIRGFAADYPISDSFTISE